MEPHFLTDEERAVLDLLAAAWNQFTELPVQHPTHQQEFMLAVHQAQRLVMSRPTARVEGWVLPIAHDKSETPD